MDKMNMPKMPMCETCRWWRAEHHADDERDEDGHCRRRSPVWGGPGDNFQSDPGVWPATYFDDWCGEHAPRREQAPAVGKAMRDRPIAGLGLCTRVLNALRAHDIQTIGQLLDTTEAELIRVRMVGKSGLADIRAQLAKLGLCLAKTLCDTAQEPSP